MISPSTDSAYPAAPELRFPLAIVVSLSNASLHDAAAKGVRNYSDTVHRGGCWPVADRQNDVSRAAAAV